MTTALRALDAIQLACGLKVRASIDKSIIFLSADVLLLAAATAEGFTIDNPNLHP